MLDFLSFDMIPSVKYFQLWSITTIWDNFWKPWKKVAFLAQICQEKGDFCRHSSGTTYCFCQIFDIQIIQHLLREKFATTSKTGVFGSLLPKNDDFSEFCVFRHNFFHRIFSIVINNGKLRQFFILLLYLPKIGRFLRI